MVDIIELQMLPEEKPAIDLGHCDSCTCATGDFQSNPFCTMGQTN